MLTLKVLGPRNPYARKVEQHTRAALGWLAPNNGHQFEMVSVTEPSEFGKLVHKTPALAINDQVVCEGHIPAINEVMTWVAEAMQTEPKDA